MASTRVLVTGDAGFIGPNLVLRALAAQPDVNATVLDVFTCAANPVSLEGADCEVTRGDVRDTELINRLVPRFGAVAHFAAESHNGSLLVDANPFVIINVLGTVNLAKVCATHEVHLHHISTDEIFGDLAFDGPTHFTTATAYKPPSPYLASKASTDHFARAQVRSFGLTATISNYSNNYGLRQHPEKLIPRQICGLLRGRSPRVYGTGESARGWIHVDDHNDAVWAILDAGEVGETYLIGADGERSNLDVADGILEGFGRTRSDLIHVTDRPGHDHCYAIGPTSIRALSWQPRYQDFSSGLIGTIGWYRTNGSWWIVAYDVAEAGHAEHKQELQF